MKYAYFDPSNNGRVMAWLDTEAHSYNLPDAAMLHDCTDAEWALDRSQEWMVSNGGIVPYVAPPLSYDPAWIAYQQQARQALEQSDLTILRCVENGVAVPAPWQTYRADLRALLSAASGDPSQPLPARPAYPAGT